MDPSDTGTFEYDFAYLPLGIRPPDSQLHAFKKAMQSAVMDYLRESHSSGVKHPDAILASGMTAGEAAVQYFRQRGKVCQFEECPNLSSFVAQDVFKVMKLKIAEPLFSKHVHQGIFSRPDFSRKLFLGLKAYFKEAGLRGKQYKTYLPTIVKDTLAYAKNL